MDAWAWLSSEDALALHDDVIATYGGATGLRDEGLLRSALARPRHKRAYEEASLGACAAAYAYAIVKNHPFADGNKRAGLAAALAFLAYNRHRLEAPDREVADTVVALASGTLEEDALAAWFESHARPAPA